MVNQWSGVETISCTRENFTCPASGQVVLDTLSFSEVRIITIIYMFIVWKLNWYIIHNFVYSYLVFTWVEGRVANKIRNEKENDINSVLPNSKTPIKSGVADFRFILPLFYPLLVFISIYLSRSQFFSHQVALFTIA